MKVLIVGGYGFIGSYTAERLYKEGHEITILDNLAIGDIRNVDAKHHSYIFDANDSKAEEVFRNHRVDALIFSAGLNDQDQDFDAAARNHLAGLIHILALSVKYKVKKFVYISTAAVYGQQERGTSLSEDSECIPRTIDAVHKQTAENYCIEWNRMYGLHTVCLRVSDVYGHRKHTRGPGGVIHEWLDKATRGRELIVYGDGDQSRDFIYVEDVVDAICRTLNSEYSGILNISANTDTSLTDLLRYIGRLHPTVTFQHQAPRPADLPYVRIDNSRAKKILDWVPLYTIERGLSKTYYLCYTRLLSQGRKKSKKKQKLNIPLRWKNVLPYGENLAAFVLTVIFTILPPDLGFYLFDVKILYILVTGLLYGSKQALLAVVFSWGLFVYEHISKGFDVVSLLYDQDSLGRMVFYLFIGLVVGYRIDRKNTDLYQKTLDYQGLEERYHFLQQIYKDTRTIKEELQNQLLNSEDSLGTIYNVTKKLESLEPDQIFSSAIEVLQSVMKTEDISIYTISSNNKFMRLAARSRVAENYLPSSLELEDDPFLHHVIQRKTVYINKKLDSKYPLLLAPVFDGDEAIAMVMIHRVEFEHFNLYYQNLLQVVINLISSALSRAYQYSNASRHERYLEGTSVLKINYLRDVLEQKRESRRLHGIEFITLEIDYSQGESRSLEELSDIVSYSLREQDCIGMGTTGVLYIILANTDEEGAKIVQQRLANKGVITRLVLEDEAVYV